MPRKKALTEAEQKKIKRDRERQRRAKIKADPVKYEEAKKKEHQRRLKKKNEKKILLIDDLTPRQQRTQRKEWRERAKKSRKNKELRERTLQALRENTPSTDSEIDLAPVHEWNPSRLRRQETPAPLSPTPAPTPTPRPTPASPIDASPSGSPRDSRQKLQGAKRSKRHRELTRVLLGKQEELIKKQQKMIHALQVKVQRIKNRNYDIPTAGRKRQRTINEQWMKRKINVQTFLEEDDNSMISPGVKDTITKKKVKKQKRYLCDSLENLHRKYNKQSPQGLRVSYASFCRIRPFWILKAKMTDRDTCLCVLHETFKMIVDRLKSLKILQNGIDVVGSVVCDKNSYKCMSRKCEKCSGKYPNFLPFENEEISYHQWISKSEDRTIAGKVKTIRRTVKARLMTKKKELVEKFINVLPNFLLHKNNDSNQYKTMKFIRENLKTDEVLVRVDFSENFACKYFSEAQSVHFGASRQQVSIHTGVFYFLSDITGKTDSILFCSVSSCLRHDAPAVFAHLKKALTHLMKNQSIKILHIGSDGPSSQYKNKFNFYLFTQHLVNVLNVTEASWNFSESSHGKGPADEVGAAVKETANDHVLAGNDIPDYDTFVEVIKAKSNVLIYEVNDADLAEGDEMLKSSGKIKTLPGTKKMHQITWTRKEPKMINMRELTELNEFDSGSGRQASNSYSEPLVDEDSPNSQLLREGAWVLAKFICLKKQTVLYVGQIVAVDNKDEENNYTTKFTRKKIHNIMNGQTVFMWKEPDDFASLDPENIVRVLPEPTPSRRGELIFNYDFLGLEYPIM